MGYNFTLLIFFMAASCVKVQSSLTRVHLFSDGKQADAVAQNGVTAAHYGSETDTQGETTRPDN